MLRKYLYNFFISSLPAGRGLPNGLHEPSEEGAPGFARNADKNKTRVSQGQRELDRRSDENQAVDLNRSLLIRTAQEDNVLISVLATVHLLPTAQDLC